MKIEQLRLKTAYLQTVREFYSSILELPVDILNGAELFIKIGSTQLIFAETTGREPFYHFAVTIPSNKIEEAKAWLDAKVKLLRMDDFESGIAEFTEWRAKSVYFFDPAGNIVELIARLDMNNSSDEIFTSGQFLSVSEAGLVFREDKFEQSVAALMSNYSLDYFSKQQPLPHFKAIGDEEGLFVAVAEKRHWFPTSRPAEVFPIAVTFENLGKKYSIGLR